MLAPRGACSISSQCPRCSSSSEHSAYPTKTDAVPTAGLRKGPDASGCLQNTRHLCSCVWQQGEELLACRLRPKVVLGRAYADSDSGLLWLRWQACRTSSAFSASITGTPLCESGGRMDRLHA